MHPVCLCLWTHSWWRNGCRVHAYIHTHRCTQTHHTAPCKHWGLKPLYIYQCNTQIHQPVFHSHLERATKVEKISQMQEKGPGKSAHKSWPILISNIDVKWLIITPFWKWNVDWKGHLKNLKVNLLLLLELWFLLCKHWNESTWKVAVHSGVL